jgi:hypothetical protein
MAALCPSLPVVYALAPGEMPRARFVVHETAPSEAPRPRPLDRVYQTIPARQKVWDLRYAHVVALKLRSSWRPGSWRRGHLILDAVAKAKSIYMWMPRDLQM